VTQKFLTGAAAYQEIKYVQYTSTLLLKSLRLVRFLKEVSYAHQGCIYLIKNTEILSQLKITVSYFNIF